jgi:hypothetical protein
MTTQRLPRLVGWIGAAFSLGSGVWALAAPRSFYDNVATFEPYNRHFIHDIGAFTIGLGAVVLFALVTRGHALGVALTGMAVASVVHVISHAMDSELGGRGPDLPALTVVAALFVIGAAAARARHQAPEPDAARRSCEETTAV